jgi:GLPGLI family protein
MCPILLCAQTNEPVIAKAYYKLTHQYDTTKSNLINTENFVLHLGKTSSVYKSYDRILQDSAMLENFALTGSFSRNGSKRFSDNELYILSKDKESYLKTTIISKLLGEYLLNFDFPEIKWTILNETKEIGGTSCQKAKGVFGGRNYTVWFAESIPFSSGPWKLIGLPGLILAASDDTNRIKFEFSGLEYPKTNTELISWAKAEKISEEEYQKLTRAYFADPKSFLESKTGAKTFSSGPIIQRKYRNLLAPSPSVNFPLELNDHIYN